MNRTILIGRLESVPETRTTRNGKVYSLFLLEVEKTTLSAGFDFEYIPCKVWGHTAIWLANNADPGCFLAVQGRLSSYKTEVDGLELTHWEVVCDSIERYGARVSERTLAVSGR